MHDAQSMSLSRRSFVAWAGVLGAGAALSGCAPKAAEENTEANEEVIGSQPFAYDKEVWGGCHVNCGSRCPLKLYVKDGAVVRVGNDNDGTDDFGPGEIYQMRSCVRGRTNRQRIYNATRIQKPLKRVEGT
ncbi:MAG: twin-arginine translocation signal domain-containing protein, partial [Slackia sp.]|nr:twin-arginine translocation signal domain-containing protein [Slackia sp.]